MVEETRDTRPVVFVTCTTMGSLRIETATSLMTLRNDPRFQIRLILMHDRLYRDGGVAGLLDDLIPHFQGLGYEFVTTDKCYKSCDSEVCENPQPTWPGVYTSDTA